MCVKAPSSMHRFSSFWTFWKPFDPIQNLRGVTFWIFNFWQKRGHPRDYPWGAWLFKLCAFFGQFVRNSQFDEIMEGKWFCFLMISGTVPIKVIVIRISNSTWSFYCLPRCQKIHGKICLSTYKADFRLLWRWLS